MRILAGTMTALRRIVDLALIGLVVVVLFGLILGKVLPLTGHQTVIIGGGSMEPSIGLGAAIVIAPVRPAELAAGDVVSLQVGSNRTTFTHRIIDLVTRPDGLWVRTKGDANAEPDPTLVPATSIIGRVEWTVPYAGYLMAFLSEPLGVVFILGIAAALFAIAWLLESVEKGPHRVVRPVAPEATRGEPIATRPSEPPSGSGSRPVIATVATAAGPATLASIRPLARPSVPEQLAHNRDVRARRNRWLAAHFGSGPKTS